MRADSAEGRPVLPADQVDLAVETFRMLSDATRIQLLWALIGQELSVNDLAARVGKTPGSVSQHLAKLRMTRLVHTRRGGTQVFYRLENDHITQLITDAVHNADHLVSATPDHHRPDADVHPLAAAEGGAPR
ncbi:metalloregulator ArsR/SmtB family transcription factor [Klenkia sp. PcliD-1-E]|uniref:ArsR/SmtB family transcription factor n=1 Tax=Klenkia sp. PcliD-1-E TaxID=2954492 RepID=UPI00273A61FD|nr:metalloregulator ArsR/SmtB family transcription factor [Klenkia sp. PcliD-1-E]